MKHLDIKQIQEIIPHRHPFLLLDYVEDYEPGEYAVFDNLRLIPLMFPSVSPFPFQCLSRPSVLLYDA